MQDAAAWFDESQSSQVSHPDDASLFGEYPQSEPQHIGIGVVSKGEEGGVERSESMTMGSSTPGASVTPTHSNSVSESNTPARVDSKGQTTFKCDHCRMYFLGKKNLLYGKLSWPHECIPTKNNTLLCRCLGVNQGEKCTAVFKYPKAFNRHYATVHIREANKAKLDCTFEGCHRVGEEGFTRRDNLLQHLRSVHGEDIPKNPFRFNGCELYGMPLVKRGTDGDDTTD